MASEDLPNSSSLILHLPPNLFQKEILLQFEEKRVLFSTLNSLIRVNKEFNLYFSSDSMWEYIYLRLPHLIEFRRKLPVVFQNLNPRQFRTETTLKTYKDLVHFVKLHYTALNKKHRDQRVRRISCYMMRIEGISLKNQEIAANYQNEARELVRSHFSYTLEDSLKTDQPVLPFLNLKKLIKEARLYLKIQKSKRNGDKKKYS